MKQIVIISSSIRKQRKSHNVALYLFNELKNYNNCDCSILDLAEYKFPIFEEVFSKQEKPTGQTIEYVNRIKKADGIIIVSPEYNGGMPASIKNAIDLLNDEWVNKPISLCTVSSGPFGGVQALLSLQNTLWKIGANISSSVFTVPEVAKAYNSKGEALNKEVSNKLSKTFLDEHLKIISKQI